MWLNHLLTYTRPISRYRYYMILTLFIIKTIRAIFKRHIALHYHLQILFRGCGRDLTSLSSIVSFRVRKKGYHNSSMFLHIYIYIYVYIYIYIYIYI